MKKCTECRHDKPLDDFYKHPNGKDGLNARCKECVKRGASRYDRKRVRPPALRRKCKATTSPQVRARGRIKTLVSSGVLPHPNTLPCTDCGKSFEGVPSRKHRHEYDHYLGYEPPNDEKVQVVCVKCHKERECKRMQATQTSEW